MGWLNGVKGKNEGIAGTHWKLLKVDWGVVFVWFVSMMRNLRESFWVLFEYLLEVFKGRNGLML